MINGNNAVSQFLQMCRNISVEVSCVQFVAIDRQRSRYLLVLILQNLSMLQYAMYERNGFFTDFCWAWWRDSRIFCLESLFFPLSHQRWKFSVHRMTAKGKQCLTYNAWLLPFPCCAGWTWLEGHWRRQSIFVPSVTNQMLVRHCLSD